MTFELKLPLSASFAMLSLLCEMRNLILIVIYEIETTERIVRLFKCVTTTFYATFFSRLLTSKTLRLNANLMRWDGFDLCSTSP